MIFKVIFKENASVLWLNFPKILPYIDHDLRGDYSNFKENASVQWISFPKILPQLDHDPIGGYPFSSQMQAFNNPESGSLKDCICTEIVSSNWVIESFNQYMYHDCIRMRDWSSWVLVSYPITERCFNAHVYFVRSVQH